MKNQEIPQNKVMMEWENVAAYIWDKLQEEWPKFCTDNIQELSFDIWWNKKIYSSPAKLDKDEFISIITEYINNHRDLGVNDLLEDEEVAKDIRWLSEFNHSVLLDWDLRYNKVAIELVSGSEFTEEPLNYLEALKKRYTIKSSETIELIACFGGNKIGLNECLKLKEPIIDEFVSFEEKWQEKFNQEVLKPKRVLEKIIKEMFDQDGVLKKEVYL